MGRGQMMSALNGKGVLPKKQMCQGRLLGVESVLVDKCQVLRTSDKG